MLNLIFGADKLIKFGMFVIGVVTGSYFTKKIIEDNKSNILYFKEVKYPYGKTSLTRITEEEYRDMEIKGEDE